MTGDRIGLVLASAYLSAVAVWLAVKIFTAIARGLRDRPPLYFKIREKVVEFRPGMSGKDFQSRIDEALKDG